MSCVTVGSLGEPKLKRGFEELPIVSRGVKMLDLDPKTEKQDRPNKDEIKGLPAHAQYQYRQGTWYVYFPKNKENLTRSVKQSSKS